MLHWKKVVSIVNIKICLYWRVSNYDLLHERKISPTPIGLNRGWEKKI